VPVETLAPPVLREKPLERKRSPEYFSAWLSPFLKVALSHQQSAFSPERVLLIATQAQAG
jgi:hypothetical protein